MSRNIGTSGSDGWPAAAHGSACGPPRHGPVDGGTTGLASAFDEHRAAFLRALDYQEEDVLRFADDRIEQTRRLRLALDACTSWAHLIGLQADWARDESEACLIEARRLILHAGLIRHPDWLARQTRAGHRLRAMASSS